MGNIDPQDLRRAFSDTSTKDLLGIYVANDRDEYTADSFKVIAEILAERGERLPPQRPYRHPRGRFLYARAKAVSGWRSGRYRGDGLLKVEKTGIMIIGKHVHALSARFGIGLIGVFVVSLVFLLVDFTGVFAIPAVILIVGCLVNFIVLKSENLTVPWRAVESFGVDPSRKTVAIAFDGPSQCTPVVYTSPAWKDIVLNLRAKIPEKDATPDLEVHPGS